MLTTPGRLLFDSVVPKRYREDLPPGQMIGAKQISDVLQRIAEEQPEIYRDVSHRLLLLGGKASVETETSFGLEDLKSPIDKPALLREVAAAEAAINGNKKLTPDQKRTELVKLYFKLSNETPAKIFDAAMAKGSNLAKMVASGARGNKQQLSSNIGLDGLIIDAEGKPVPVPLKNNYAEGLSQAEYFGSTYGTRQGLVSTKLCCCENTLVRMADFSTKAMKDIQIGDMVLGADHDCRVFPVRVSNVFHNGNKECWEYTFRRLSSRKEFVTITATPDHKILARRREWGKRCAHLAIKDPTLLPIGTKGDGDFVACPIEGGEFLGVREPRALALGLLIGNGCMTQLDRGNLYLSTADQSLIDETREYFASFNYVVKKYGDDTVTFHRLNYINQPNKIVRPDCNGRPTGHSGDPFKAWLTEIGMAGQKAHQKHILDAVWGWDNQSVADIISGVFSTDGSVVFRNNKGSGSKGISVCLTLTARQVLEQIKDLLEIRFGIYTSTIYRVSEKGKQWMKNPQWQITISHGRSIRKLISMVRLVGEKRPKFERLLEDCTPLSNCNREHSFKRVSKRLVGVIPTMDIEVDHPEHMFVLANGLISSNSVAQSGFMAKQLSASAQDLTVTEEDCGTSRGIAVDSTDPDNVGALLAKPYSGYQEGTPIDKGILSDFRGKGLKKIVVRSPMTCQAKHGLCAACAGVRERGTLPAIGENIGIASASAISEPLSQALLCLAGNTRVRMADWSVKEIRNIVPGDWVLGSNREGKTSPVLVLNVFDNGVRDCSRFSFALDRTDHIHVDCTGDHNILARWYKSSCAGEELNHTNQILPIGYKTKKFSAVLPNACASGLTVEEPFDLFLGLVLGNGCCTESVNGVHFSTIDLPLIEETREYLASLNLKLTKLQGHDCYYRFSQVDAGTNVRDPETGRMTSEVKNPAQIAVRRFGTYGHKAHEKFIPQEAFGWSDASVARLLSGLFATDGSVYLAKDRDETRLRISYGSTSRQLISQIKDLLQWRFGIYASRIYVTKAEKKQWAKNDQYNILLAKNDSVKKFIDLIPILGEKGQRIADWKKYTEIKCNVDCRKVLRKSIEPLGQLPTFDIEVDHPDHLFVLENGLIVSNSSKHSAGVANAGKAARIGGFQAINALFQSPKTFPDGASVATKDGKVTRIEKAPQGGHYIEVAGERHYSAPNREIGVRLGQDVEAGDALDDGVISPTDAVQYRGVGDGRRYFLDQLKTTLDDNGIGANRRNLEVLSRAAINHVQIGDPEAEGDMLPDDIVRYDKFEQSYTAPKDTATRPLKESVGKYLQKPVLHYSIGTRITPRVAKSLEEVGETDLDVSDEAPKFKPRMVRLMENPSYGSDWMSQLGSSYVKGNLLDNIHRGGASADIHGASPLPGLAYGMEFGKPKPESNGAY